MPHLEVAALDQHADLGLQFQQAHEIAHAGAGSSDSGSDLLMRHTEFAHQAIEGERFLDRIELLRWMFDQRDAHRIGVRDVLDQCRNAGESGELRRASAARRQSSS